MFKIHSCFNHGQKFATHDIAHTHERQNMASDSSIRLLVIVHKKFNRRLPTKYFQFVPLICGITYPNGHIRLYLRFCLDKMMCHNRRGTL